MLNVTKFGGSSLADAARFLRVRDIVLSDISRRVVVVSAAGKRHGSDHKITDLLYLCHAHLQYGVSCWDLFRRISARYIEIRDGCGLSFPIEQELDAIYARLGPDTSADYLASRGEYLSAKLMAELLGYVFVDATSWLQFDYAGRVLREESYAALQSLADGRKIVTPGFYGALPDGSVHTFSRGGSDVTGSLAAAALHADIYENWTDVDGVLAADPKIVDKPATIDQLTFDELQTLSQVGTQVLHESAVAPVREQQIPLQIRNTWQPERPGTLIRSQRSECAACHNLVGFTGHRQIAMLTVQKAGLSEDLSVACDMLALLTQAGLQIFHYTCGLDGLTVLICAEKSAERLHAAADELKQRFTPVQVKLRENLAVLAALFRNTDVIPGVVAAVQQSGVPVHHMIEARWHLLMLVNDSQFETALRAAYKAR